MTAAGAIDLSKAEAVETKIEAKEEEVEQGPCTIVPGPEYTAGDKYHEKLLKAVIKEGGKRGVEIEGAADMGGLKFFCTVIDKPDGDLTLLIESVKAMNAKSDPSEEERKGGAGKLGKMIFSCSAEKLAIVAYAPKDQSDDFEKSEGKEGCSAIVWLKKVVQDIIGSEDYVVEMGDRCAVKACEGVSENNWAVCSIEPNSDDKEKKNLFPMKIRDPAITAANTYLKSRGLFPDGDDDSDDEVCYGDDDFDF